MTLGVAIPTYIGHIHYLDRILDNIEASTVRPQEVSVSISECVYKPKKKYAFKLILTHSKEVKSAAQNINTALGKLTTDIVSVIGCDDLMHPQRNEFILKAFENNNINIVVHNFLESLDVNEDFLNSRYEQMELEIDYIDTLFDNCLYPKNPTKDVDFGNGLIAFKREIFDLFQYDESEEARTIEDSLFNRKLVENGYKLSYIKQKLVLYLKNPNPR
jgi:hypothetical protein